ncbi:hypothetical protein QCA50_011330 [Cerrena zonata]|uniref:DUF6593 domain-containing protein n=1 Tax=Cerrena zonata TaxID=2478898 RepID=A0AAW0FX66_9APHY
MIITQSEVNINQAGPSQSNEVGSTEEGRSANTPPAATASEPPSYTDVIRSSGGRPQNRNSSVRSRHANEASTSGVTSSPGGTRSAQEQCNIAAAQGPVSYKFITQSFNSMILVYEPANLPLYHISTHVNCFIPSSYITIVRRGDSESGRLVGQFEMGISVKKSTVLIDGREKVTDAVLMKSKFKSIHYWLWRWHSDEGMQLRWSYDSPVKYCFRRDDSTSDPPVLASYTPPPLVLRDARPSPMPILKVYPEGQPFIDHILLSALIIERKRLTPSSATSVMSWSI